MPHDLAMDMATGDLVLRDGDVLLIDNAERVAQQILITLRFWLGDGFSIRRTAFRIWNMCLSSRRIFYTFGRYSRKQWKKLTV